MKIEVNILQTVTETGKKFYGGEVLLNKDRIKIIPYMDDKTKVEKYLNCLRKNLKVRTADSFIFITYKDNSGNSIEYWNNVYLP